MTRFDTQVQRLFLAGAAGEGQDAWVDAQGRVRVIVISLDPTGDWSMAMPLWQGVQQALSWPAPGIAAAAHQGWQIWMPFEEPWSLSQAAALALELGERFLGGGEAPAWRAWPSTVMAEAEAVTPAHCADVDWVRSQGLPDPSCERWPAFVAPDLAAVFGETPWLEVQPNPEGQADLLARVLPIPSSALPVLETPSRYPRLQPARIPTAAPASTADPQMTVPDLPAPAGSAGSESSIDPLMHLVAVMRDPQADPALRLQAAVALLPHRAEVLALTAPSRS